MSKPLSWLIFGAEGWIGKQLVQILSNKRAEDFIEFAQCRADDEPGVEHELRIKQPDRVICLVGRTHGPGFNTIDYLEQRDKLGENLRDNLYAPLVLQTLCYIRGIHFTYLSTGCIYEYDAKHTIENEVGFTEEDKPNFDKSAYSCVRGFTQRLMNLLEPVMNNALTARIRMPINTEDHARNFVIKITRYAKVCSIENSMSVLPNLLPILIDMAVVKKTGTVNFTNPGHISHNRILELYKEIVDPTFVWQNFSIEEQDKILAAKRSNNILSTEKLKEFAPHVPDIETAVVGVFKEMAQNRLKQARAPPL